MSQDIKSLIEQGRTHQLDWLPEQAELDEIAEMMVAIANAVGGTLVIGVEEHTITGITDADDTTDRIIQAALAIEPPLIIPMPRTATLDDDQTVILAQIPAGMPNVYSYRGRYLKRSGTYNAALPPRDLRRLMLERGELSYETDAAAGATLEDIDWEKARDYMKGLRGIGTDSVEQVLLKRGCLLRTGGGALRPTNAGILLFGKDPQRFAHSATVTAVRFASESMSDTFSRHDIHGTLDEQIKRAETFLVDHLRKDVTLSGTMARREHFEYPMEAARELVVNAVAHRDYSINGDEIRLFLFSNRMEVHSPGGLPGPMTVDNLKDQRFSRNPVIVQILSDMGFIERLGYGVDRVIELMQEKNLQAPAFEETAGGFRVVLYNQPLVTEAEQPEAAARPEAAQGDIEFHGVYEGTAINPRQEAALIYLHNDNTRITNSDLKGMFPDIHPETIRRDLVDLVNKDILMKMGQKRGSYYVLKSRPEQPAQEARASAEEPEKS